MKQVEEHIDELIGLVLTGQANSADFASLQTWLDASPDNRHYFAQMRELFHRTEFQHEEFDTDRAWKNVQETLGSARVIPMKPVKRLWLRYTAAAAVVVALLASYWFFSRREEVVFAMESGATVLHDTLPDGSVAALNKASSLEFSMDHRSGKRTVRLKGEAQFNVKHDEQSEFVIETGDVYIRDIGTAFNVKSPENADSIVVTVTEGMVAFYSDDNRGLNLIAGERGIYAVSTKVFIKEIIEEDTDNENVSAYADKDFRFHNARIEKVIRQVNEVYGTSLQLENAAMGMCRISVRFKDESLDSIVGILAETMGWEVEKRDNQITFLGDGCSE